MNLLNWMMMLLFNEQEGQDVGKCPFASAVTPTLYTMAQKCQLDLKSGIRRGDTYLEGERGIFKPMKIC